MTIAIIGFSKLKYLAIGNIPHNDGFISIVISARNESENIKQCIDHICNQNFPKANFELIIVDDFSDDSTYYIALEALNQSGISYQLIKQKEHQGKKINLSLAIQKSKGEIIITSDADVIYRDPNWLLSISHYFKLHSPNMLIMPIDFESEFSVLGTFQIVENIALTGITAGFSGIQKPFMCNGANLAFTKKAYESVNGYNSHLHISSGEDVFLLEDIKKINPGLVHYSLQKELIIKTKCIKGFKNLFNQRIRWASKAKQNSNHLNLFIGFITVAANLLFLALFVAILKKSVIIPYLSIFVLTKFVFDFLLLFLASNLLRRTKYIGWLIPFECIYWMYALIIGTASMFIKPYWKGKKIN